MRQVSSGKAVASQVQAKLGLLRIAHLRFCAFVTRFNREPGLHDPLFFDESQGVPVKADLDTARRQLGDAARTLGLALDPVLELVGLPNTTQAKKYDRAAAAPRPKQSRRPLLQASPSRRAGSAATYRWHGFLTDQRLHRRYGVTPRELRMLSSASFLGEVRNPEDFLLVLNVIRKRKL